MKAVVCALVLMNAALIPLRGNIAPALCGIAVSDEIVQITPIQVLTDELKNQAGFVQVHAAEALLQLQHPADVPTEFHKAEVAFGERPQIRMGIWRVLALAADSPSDQAKWRQKIVDAFLDVDGPDRIHAVESLAKLKYRIPDSQKHAFTEAARSTDSGLAIYARWALAVNEDATQETQISSLLSSADPIERLRAAYILQRLDSVSPDTVAAILKAAETEPAESSAYAYIVSAAAIVSRRSGAAEVFDHWHGVLTELSAKSSDATQRATACHTLAETGSAPDAELLRHRLRDENPDVRISAAYALEKIARRTRTPQ
ncbi:MAG: HEAT repeat domain-containing protein [Planctomycetaceae bacterium]|nr:HEAT repeat domain-containing protein [Planctomycetaceae bacterium]